MEVSINERINSNLYSDVINSYVDINSVTSTRNIVPGSYKETVSQCLDQTLATLNSAGGQTLFTRLLLTPQVRNATLAQLAQIYFQYVIPANSLGIIMKKITDVTSYKEDITEACDVNFGTGNVNAPTALHFKLFYDTGFSIASMVQLCLTADAKVSTENFNYQQSLLTLNSLPDQVTDNSNSETTLRSLVGSPTYRGVGSGLITAYLRDSVNATNYLAAIGQDIGIEGVIDLDKGNPLFHNFPIITRNMGELYIRLYMENFLRELKVVYLDKEMSPKTFNGTAAVNIANGSALTLKGTNADASVSQQYTLQAAANNIGVTGAITVTGGEGSNWLPYQRLPADKPDFVYLNGDVYKVKLINLRTNADFIQPDGTVKVVTSAPTFAQTNPIYTLANISWKRFEIRKVEFDIEDFEDIKASQAKAGVYKFPVHIFRSKNFDQTNAASSSSNALQTTLNAPNIDRIFITQPFSRDYYTFLPTIASTDINPQLHNNPVLPRTEDCLNSRTVARIASVFIDTDKHAPPTDLINSLDVPTVGKKLWLKGQDTYGGQSAFEEVQRGIVLNKWKVLLPNKFSYALELNEGGCFRRGYNSVIDGRYSPVVPVNLQQSVGTSADIYNDAYAAAQTYDTADQNVLANNSTFNAAVSYGHFMKSGAVASIHCLCDYVFHVNFDAYGNMVDFGISEYNDRQ